MIVKTLSVRDRVMNTAYRLFYTQGYNATGINQIIGESGVAKASLYANFRSKEELCVAYLTKRHIFWMNLFNTYLNTHKEEVGVIEILFDFIAYMNAKEGFRGCAFINLVSEISVDNKAILKVIIDHKMDLRKLFKTLIDTESTGSKVAVADGIYLLFEGAILESSIFKNDWPVKVAKETALAIFNNNS